MKGQGYKGLLGLRDYCEGEGGHDVYILNLGLAVDSEFELALLLQPVFFFPFFLLLPLSIVKHVKHVKLVTNQSLPLSLILPSSPTTKKPTIRRRWRTYTLTAIHSLVWDRTIGQCS